MNEKQKQWINDKCRQLKEYCLANLDRFTDEDWEKLIITANDIVSKAKGHEAEAKKIVFNTVREIDYEDYKRKQSKYRH